MISGILPWLLTVTLQISLLAWLLLVIQYLFLRRDSNAAVRFLTCGLGCMILLIGVSLAPLPAWSKLFDWPAVPELFAAAETNLNFKPDSRVADQPGDTRVDLFPAIPSLAERMASQQPDTVRQTPSQAGTSSLVPSGFRSSLRQWLCAGLLILIGFGVLRLLMGCCSLLSLLRRSQHVTDQDVWDQTRRIASDYQCQLPHSILQSGSIGTAATIGWRRPVILLSDQFRDWEPDQLASVLAHELAHVRHGDFARILIAQICSALHFFNPLVHWCVSRLRIHQEWAADRLAADYVQDRLSYAATLAQMALHQDDLRRLSIASPLIPNEHTFIRRVKMLKQSPVPFRSKPTWLFSMIALTIALMVCGLRLSGTSVAQAGDLPQEGQIEIASLDHVSSHSSSVNIFRPAVLMNDRGVKDLLEKTPLLGDGINKQNKEFENLIGIEFAGIDQITICQTLPGSENSHNYVVVRTVEPAADKFREAADRVENRREGDLLFNDDAGQSTQFREGVVIDENTVIWAAESESLRFAMEVKENDAKATDWYGLWKEAGMEPFIYLGERELLQELGESLSQNPSTRHVIKPQHIEDLQAANALAMTADFDGKFRFNIYLEYDDSSMADQALDSAKDVADMALAMVNVMARAAQGPERMFLNAGLEAMTNLTLNSKRNTMMAETQFELDTELVNEMTNDVRAAARRTQSANNVRQMTLAMHNFHDAYGHFPPAVITHESGKVHSWRIAMLPFLERQDIYDRYRFNEDWDSPHNQEVTRAMPEFFRHPEAKGESNQTNYFAVVGEGTLWGSGAPVNLAQVTDGSHSTIMFVESAQGAHWAQPVELNLEDVMANGAGGFSEGGFNASMADGSVQFIPNTISDEHLRAMFSMDAGDAIKDDE